MRILLTGATGRVGPTVVDYFVAAGHDLTVIGRTPDLDLPGARYVRCDIEDYDKLLALTRGQDAVAHLAAISDPNRVSDQDTFRINTAGTFNIFQAAAEAGVRCVVQASSINAIGHGHALRPVEPSYLPIDERHPTNPRDPYSLSKVVIEDLGRYFWDRFAITSFALRLPGVFAPTEANLARLAATDHDAIAEGLRLLEAMPVPERCAFMAEHHLATRQARAEHWRRRREGLPPVRDSRNDDPRWRALAQRGGFWTQCDARDVATAIERCLTVDRTGAHTLFINDDRNNLGVETERLLAIGFPMVRGRKQVFQGCESLVSVEHARVLLGWRPKWHLAEMSEPGSAEH